MSVMVSDVVTEIEEHVPHKLKPRYYYRLLFVTIYSFHCVALPLAFLIVIVMIYGCVNFIM